MSRIKFTFPNAYTAFATMQEEQEPECCAMIWDKLKQGPLRIACYHTVSTGGFYAGFLRPPAEPVSSGTQVDAIGHNNKMIYDLERGDISWTGWSFWFAYSDCTEPVGIGGPVAAKIDEDYIAGFIDASNDVWLHQYTYHKLPVIVVEREED